MYQFNKFIWLKLHQKGLPIAVAISSIITIESELSLGDEDKERTKIILNTSRIIYADESFDTLWVLLGSVG